MNDLERGWLAGIIDGEGTIALTARGPCLTIPSTEPAIISKALDVIGSGCRTQKRRATGRGKNYEVLHVRGQALVSAMQATHQLLVEPYKREKARLLAEDFFLNPHGVVHTVEQKAKMLVFKERFLAVGCGRVR